MASNALRGLHTGLTEVRSLQRANPSPAAGGGIERPAITRAIGRAEIVLLSGHLERYVYAIYQEMIDTLSESRALMGSLPLELRLLQSRDPLDRIALTQWDRREKSLREFTELVGHIWRDGRPVTDLDAESLLRWMKTPAPKQLIRAFRYWGIDEILTAITRTNHNRMRLEFKLQELVDKRNNIAHGDQTAQATYNDVWGYLRAVQDFCDRTDKQCSRVIAQIGGTERPW